MENTTFKIGDKITYTGTITSILSNGERVEETSDEFAILMTKDHEFTSFIAKYASKV